MDVKKYIEQNLQQLRQSPLYGHKDFPMLSDFRNQLELLASKLTQPLHAAIIGEVKAGKSTLLNAFAGGEVSPVNTTETTACILKIGYGSEEKGTIYYKDGHSMTDAVPAIYQLLESHRQDQNFFIQCDYVAIQKPLSGLKHIYLIDTPGLETITAMNEERTLHYFQSVDVVLWVFNGNYLGQADINEHLRQLARMGKPIVAIINRIDQLDGDPQELVDYLDDQLGIYVEEIFPLSAKNAYEGILAHDEAGVKDSGFADLYNYLDEHIERRADQVQMDSIRDSAMALHDQIYLIHKQAMEQIELKMKTYLDLDEQIQYNGHLMQQKAMSQAQDWLQHDFLREAENALHNKISQSGFFSADSKSYIHQELENLLSKEAVQQEVDNFLQRLQANIYQDWQGRLSDIDEELSQMYQKVQLKNDFEISQLQQVFAENNGMDSMKDSMLAAGAAGGALSIYSAVLGPAASYVSIGTAAGTIMPPLLMAGAAIGLVAGYSKNKKRKNRQDSIVNEVISHMRDQISQELLPCLQGYLEKLCAQTQEEARREFVEKNFNGQSVAGLKGLIQQLQQFLATDVDSSRLMISSQAASAHL